MGNGGDKARLVAAQLVGVCRQAERRKFTGDIVVRMRWNQGGIRSVNMTVDNMINMASSKEPLTFFEESLD